jgi:hypothetical protein
MHQFLLAVVLAAGHPAGDVGPDAAALAAAMAPELQTGTLLFSKGDCLAVKMSAGGPYTHVAAVVLQGDAPVVYDSMNGIGVRKLSLPAYLASQAPDEIDLLQPRHAFTLQEALVFEAALQQRVGAPYAVLHYVMGRRASAGVHCSEYVTDALESIEWLDVARPPRISPSSLHENLVEGDVYATASSVHFPLQPEPVEAEGWWKQLWLDTKHCCSGCCDQLSAWFLCR